MFIENFQDSLEKQERRKRHLSGGPLSALDAERSGREYTPAENRPKIGELYVFLKEILEI